MAFKKRKHVKRMLSDRIFIAADWIILMLFLVLLLYPLLFVVSASLSGGSVTMSLSLIPKTISLAGYKAVFGYSQLWRSYLNSAVYACVGTLISLIVTVCCAYPLSRSELKYGKYMMALCIFTMYFSGGMIPTYLTIKNMHMLDTIWALVIPGSLSVYNMIVMRTYFKTQIPEELREAAKIDGCPELKYLLSIVIPLSVPILAVITLFCIVGHWNSYFGPMLYLSSNEKFPLAMILRNILVLNNVDPSQGISIGAEELVDLQKRRETMKYAVILVSSVPMLIIYPFVQKYFVKGIMIGSVKG